MSKITVVNHVTLDGPADTLVCGVVLRRRVTVGSRSIEQKGLS